MLFKAWRLLLAVVCLAPAVVVAADEAISTYVMDYPAADRFCPPVAGFFDEVQRRLDRVGTHTFTHQPNGGYGLPVQDMVAGQHLIHVGADVGWYQVGAPVFAVANGVVRTSEGPPPRDPKVKTKSAGKSKAGAATKASGEGKSPVELSWGNLVVIEHKLPDGKYATTIYGHLASDRFVEQGEIVRAGQQIGTIGTTRVNGGYKPHLHFGVRPGRLAEAGRKLFDMNFNGKPSALTIADVRDDKLIIGGVDDLPDRTTLTLGDQTIELIKRDGNVEAPVALLSKLPPAGFPIVGYALSTDGWADPIAFLRQQHAEIAPAQFEFAQRRRPTKRSAVETAKKDAADDVRE